MEEITSINIRDVVKLSNGGGYRVLHIENNEIVFLCQMNTTVLRIYPIGVKALFDDLATGRASIECCETSKVVDKNHLTQKVKNKFEKKMGFVNKVSNCYGPSFYGLMGKASKPDFVCAYETCGIKKGEAWRTIRQYLQSGCEEYSVLDGRVGRDHINNSPSEGGKRRGRQPKYGLPNEFQITPENEYIMEEALNRFCSNRNMTMKEARNSLLHDHFCETVALPGGGVGERLLPPNMLPTERQVNYYFNKKLTIEEKSIIKTSKREFRNDQRILMSDSLYGVHGPMDCVEMDEVEVDVSLVADWDANQTIGRPIMYIMIDVFSHLIVGYSVSLENNSILGATNCMLSLMENKTEMCRRHGIEISPEMWPYGYLPARLRVDRGSEYTSKEMQRICKELNITLQLEPPAMGSLKGTVERYFHQFQSELRPRLANHGLIEKRHDSKHHADAVLTLHEFERLAVISIASYNKRYMESYSMTKEMIASKIEPIPYKLYAYGVKEYGSPMTLPPKEEYMFKLMRPISCSISREGVRYKTLVYMNFDDKTLLSLMVEGRTKKKEFRIDPRTVDNIYYVEAGELRRVPLNPIKTVNEGYKGLTLSEYEALLAEKKQMDAKGREYNTQLDVAVLAMQKQIMDGAGNGSPANAKGIREARKQAKAMEQSRKAMSVFAEAPISVPQGIEKAIADEQKEPASFEDYYENYY